MPCKTSPNIKRSLHHRHEPTRWTTTRATSTVALHERAALLSVCARYFRSRTDLLTNTNSNPAPKSAIDMPITDGTTP